MSAEPKKISTRKTTKKSAVAEHLLTGDLTLTTAAEVKELFVKALAQKKDMIFRFVNVGDIDLSFVQILCSAHHAAHENGKKLKLEGDSPGSFSRLLEESGLNVHVGCSLDGDVECPWLINTKIKNNKEKD